MGKAQRLPGGGFMNIDLEPQKLNFPVGTFVRRNGVLYLISSVRTVFGHGHYRMEHGQHVMTMTSDGLGIEPGFLYECDEPMEGRVTEDKDHRGWWPL